MAPIFFQTVSSLVGDDHCEVFTNSAKPNSWEDSYGYLRAVLGCVWPESLEHVQKVVQIAREHNVKLYPISRGRNLGYGGKLPVEDDCVVLDLSRMNNIRAFDEVAGKVEVEPGVTQQQLYEFLISKNSKFWCDVTGASCDSSPLGNAIEGGFGHTPKGNHRSCISNVEVVLGDGSLLQCGQFPNLGPDLNGIFVQSNFGIITAMTLELFPIPEHFESFVIAIDDDSVFEEFVDMTRYLVSQNTINSLVHIGNAVRALMTLFEIPPGFEDRTISNREAAALLKSPVAKVGHWQAMGGLYGTREEIRAKKRVLKSRYKSIGRVQFFSNRKVKLISSITSTCLSKHFDSTLGSKADSLKLMHELLQGKPSDKPFDHILWRCSDRRNMGLKWIAPVLRPRGNEIHEILAPVGDLFKTFNFEFPVTLTFIDSFNVVAIINISFNLADDEQVSRANELFQETKILLDKKGVKPYRSDIDNMSLINYHDLGKTETLKRIKTLFDPDQVISPGRYGI